jgi:adenosylmethionine-8-amino-7-oxononanoate aminotransferase
MGDFSDVAQGDNPTFDPDKNLLPGHSQQSTPSTSAVLHRTLHALPPQMVSANKQHVKFSNGQTMLDSTCGAGVACLGYTNKRVRQAMIDQIDKFSYCNSMFFGHPIGEELASELVQGTGGAMAKAFVVCSGKHCCQHHGSLEN